MTVDPEYSDGPNRRIELDPFARFNWKSADSRELLRDRMTRASEAKAEAEWRSVLAGSTARKAAIIHVSNSNREKWIRRAGENGLSYRAIRYSEPYNGFSHRVRRADPNDPNRITYSVIAKNPDIADKMEEAENEIGGPEGHDIVGELLGFPDCCRTFFRDRWLGEEEDRKIDPIYEISCQTESAETIDGDRENIRLTDANPYANILFRYFGWSFITHMPCSFECQESIDIGRERHKIMENSGYGTAASIMFDWLAQPHVWDGLHGIANVRNQHITGTAGTSTYWSKKRVQWGKRKHFPRMKDVYTAEDLARVENHG